MKESSLEAIFSERFQFARDMREKYRAELTLLEQIYDLGKSMSQRFTYGSDKKRLFEGNLAMACVRTICGIESLAILMVLGNSADCGLILRSIFDLLVQMLYIEKEPELRSLLYSRYETSAYVRFLKEARDNFPSEGKDYDEKILAQEDALKFFHEKIREIDPDLKISDRPTWSGRTMKKMAEDVNLKSSYQTIYWDLSGITHSSSSASRLFIRVDSKTQLAPIFYPNEIISGQASRATAYYSLRILELVNTHLHCREESAISKLQQDFQRFYRLV
jgi:hypothetical protein